MRFSALLNLVPLFFLASQGLWAQVVGTSPVPSQFNTATTVFLANDGGDHAYQSLYRALTAWKKFRLVSTPAEAELAFEVSGQESQYVTGGTSLETPYVRVRVLDVKTHVLLWSLSESIGRRQRDQEFDRTAEKLVEDLKALAGGQFPHAPSKTKATTKDDQNETSSTQEGK